MLKYSGECECMHSTLYMNDGREISFEINDNYKQFKITASRNYIIKLFRN